MIPKFVLPLTSVHPLLTSAHRLIVTAESTVFAPRSREIQFPVDPYETSSDRKSAMRENQASERPSFAWGRVMTHEWLWIMASG